MRRKDGEYTWGMVTPEQRKRQKELEGRIAEAEEDIAQLHNRQILKTLSFQRYWKGNIKCDPDDAMKFVDACSVSIGEARRQKQKEILPKEEFLQLMEEYKIDDEDLVKVIQHTLIRNPDKDYRDLGEAIITAASRAGNESATVRVMYQAYLQSNERPEVLSMPTLVLASQHLREIAKKGENFRAQVLQGRLDHEKGDRKSAIRLWSLALDPAIEYAKHWTRSKKGGEVPELEALTSPWVELANEHNLNGDTREERLTFMRGIEADDPTSHYQAALSYRQWDASRTSSATSKSLYYLTKAAASGWVPAMHSLAIHYSGGNTWPYIVDEPPDYVKPTPFDRFPPTSGARKEEPLWTRARAALGFGPESTKEEYRPWLLDEDDDSTPGPADDLFHTAAMPSDIQGRYRMALQWLEVAMGYQYAPSYLLAARLHLEKSVHDDIVAPREAVNLERKRYTYASKADYDLGRPSNKQDLPLTKSQNPFYNPQKAKDLIREIFYADGALQARMDFLARRRKPGEQFFSKVRAELPANLDKWFSLPDLYRHWMDERRGLLRDEDMEYRDLVAEARAECDAHGWDIYAEHDGGLLYRHTPKKK